MSFMDQVNALMGHQNSFRYPKDIKIEVPEIAMTRTIPPKPKESPVSFPTVAEVIEKDLPATLELMPLTIDAACDDEAFERYYAKSRQLGIKNKAMTVEYVSRLLQKLEIPNYSMPKVSAFLDKLQKAENIANGVSYEVPKYSYGIYEMQMMSMLRGKPDWGWRPVKGYGEGVTQTYSGKIPERAIDLMTTLEGKCKDAQFFISELSMVKPDPFLMMSIDGERFVIMHWDEPGFKINE